MFTRKLFLIELILSQVQQAATGPPKYSGPIDVVKGLYKEGGIRSIFRGTCATLLRGKLELYESFVSNIDHETFRPEMGILSTNFHLNYDK